MTSGWLEWPSSVVPSDETIREVYLSGLTMPPEEFDRRCDERRQTQPLAPTRWLAPLAVFAIAGLLGWTIVGLIGWAIFALVEAAR